MSILFKQTDGVLFQGPQTIANGKLIDVMRDFKTNILATSFPLSAETIFHGVPSYCSVDDACNNHSNICISIINCHPSQVKSLTLEAIDGSIKTIIIQTGSIPVHDSLLIAHEALKANTLVIGPDSKGILIPKVGLVGSMTVDTGFSSSTWLQQGPIAVITRSADVGLFLTYTLKKEGLGISCLMDLGSIDYQLGLGFGDVLTSLEKHDNTQIVVIAPGINTVDYQSVVSALERGLFTKPLLAFIPGNQIKKDIFLRQNHFFIDSNMILEKLQSVDINVQSTLDNITQAVGETLKGN